MSGGYCSYVGSDCECYANAVKCAQVPAVKCHERREKVIKQKEVESAQDLGGAISSVVYNE